jgi:hypothetical protein
MSVAPPKKRSWLAPVLTVVGISSLCFLCIVPSMPNFFADRQQHRHQECRDSLSAVMLRFEALRDGGVSMNELKAALPAERLQPYTYVLGEGVTVESKNKPPSGEERDRQLAKVRTLVNPGVRGTCPDCTFTIACVGNTDDDPELDLLSLSSQERYVFGTLPVRAGETYLHQKDFASDPEVPALFEPSDAGR